MAVVPVLLAVAVILVAARWFVAYLRFRRIELALPGPPSWPILGNAIDFLGATEDTMLATLIDKLWGYRYELSRMSLAGNLVVIVSDADDLERLTRSKETQDKSRVFYDLIMDMISPNGLVSLNGPTWRTHRKAIQPAFHASVLDRYQEIFHEESKNFVRHVKLGVSEDIIHILPEPLVRIFIRTTLRSDIESVEDAVATITECAEVIPVTLNWRFFRPWLWPNFIFGLTPAARRCKALLAKLDEFTSATITRRRERLRLERQHEFVKERRTLIDILVDSTEDGHLTDKDMQDEVNLFLGAAVETTASSLGWTLKVLSVRPDVQQRLHEEVKEVLDSDGVVTTDSIARLHYTERVLKETMRLLPTVLFVARTNHEDLEWNGKTIPKDTTLVINIFGAHRDPRHWEKPLEFDPDRFLPERSVGRHPYAYLPFSMGPRNCIGGRYAMQVLKTMLANIVAQFHVEPVDDGHVDPGSFPMTFDLASRMLGGVHVVFTPRNQQANPPTQAEKP